MHKHWSPGCRARRRRPRPSSPPEHCCSALPAPQGKSTAACFLVGRKKYLPNPLHSPSRASPGASPMFAQKPLLGFGRTCLDSIKAHRGPSGAEPSPPHASGVILPRFSCSGRGFSSISILHHLRAVCQGPWHPKPHVLVNECGSKPPGPSCSLSQRK